MNDVKPTLILWAFSFVPYLVVAWVLATLGDGQESTFWLAFGSLLLARLFFAIIETLGTVLSWRVYGRRLMIDRNLAILRTNSFPKRTYAHDDFLAYLSRIEDDNEATPILHARAKEMTFVLSFYESVGILVGMRMHDAAEKALDIYSPSAEAPVYGARAAQRLRAESTRGARV